MSEIKEFFSNRKTVISLIIVIILILGLAIGVYLVQQRQIFKPKAAAPKDEITLLTEQLLQADQKYDEIVSKTFIPQIATPIPAASHPAQPIATSSAVQAEKTSKEAQEQLKSMQSIAIKRKELLLQQIKENPQEFLNKATLVDKRDSFPKEVKPYIEQRIQAQGKLTVIHIDDFDNKKSRYEYFLENKYKLYFVKDPPQVLSGSEVKVEGIELGEQVALSTGNAQPNQEGLQIITAATPLPTTGEQKTAIILIKFADQPNVPVPTNADVENIVFGATNSRSVNNYYKENSYNKTYFTGQTFGWYTVPFEICSASVWTFRAYEQARAEGVDWRDGTFGRLIYVFPNHHDCAEYQSFAGWATIGGNPSESWIISINKRGDATTAHELGHNLGNEHANSISCGSNQIDDSSTCKATEYGDPFDVMGNAIYYNQFNAPHKINVGWIPEANVKKVAENGVYTITSLEDAVSSTQVLKISKSNTRNYYYVSYRQKKGFDNNLTDGITRGASIHFAPDDPNSTFLIDITPGGENFNDAGLYDGAVFNDLVNGISIKQISHTLSTPTTPGSVALQISFNEIFTPTPLPKLISWNTLTPFPFGIERHSIIAYKNKLFVIGGFTDTGPQNKVYSANINNDSTLGSWNELISNTLPLTLYNFGLVAERNHLFVIGGESDLRQIRQSAVYSSRVDDTGTLGPWNELQNTPLPQKLFRPSIISANGYIYVSGGSYTSSQYIEIFEPKVYSALIKSDGTLGNWNELTTALLPKSLTDHKSVVAGGFIFVLGGRNQDWSRSLSVYSAKINGDGALGSWNELEDTPLPLPASDFRILSAGVVGYENYLLLIGGSNNTGDYSNVVYVAKVNSDGTLGSWTTDEPLPSRLASSPTAIWGNRLFVVGGNGLVGGISLPKTLDIIYSGLMNLPTPFVCTACAADIVKSARNRVDAQDNALLSSCFGKSPSESLPGGKVCTPADINKDGSINQTDVDCLRSVYFQTCAATGSATQR